VTTRLVARLAVADAVHDRGLLLCSALTIAAVLLPLLLLFGLKTGIVEQMLADLRRDPEAVRVTPRQSGSFRQDWFSAMRQRPDVGFIAPVGRYLGNAVTVSRPEDPIRGIAAGLLISGPGDPMLRPAADRFEPGHVVLSERLAADGGFSVGDEVLVWSRRNNEGGGFRRIDARARVAAIAPATPERAGRFVFALSDLAGFLEDGIERDTAPDAPDEREFASFRLYASDITVVEQLARHLEAAGLEVDTGGASIARVFGINRNLTFLFALIGSCAAIGVGGALAAILWTNVARKRRSLSLLRLIGTSAGSLAVFPLVQAGLIAMIGAALASAAALAAAAGINTLYGETYGMGELCLILPEHLAGAALGVLAIAMLAAAVAVRPILGIAPAEGIVEG